MKATLKRYCLVSLIFLSLRSNVIANDKRLDNSHQSTPEIDQTLLANEGELLLERAKEEATSIGMSQMTWDNAVYYAVHKKRLHSASDIYDYLESFLNSSGYDWDSIIVVHVDGGHYRWTYTTNVLSTYATTASSDKNTAIYVGQTT